jgi:hypothetical protein
MTAYEPGDVILVPYPFGERAGGRKRPALVISSREHNEETGELVVAQNNLTIMNFSYTPGYNASGGSIHASHA